MSETVTPKIHGPRRVYSDYLREMGFEPGTLIVQSTPRFAIEDMKAALFNTRYSNPETIPVTLVAGSTIRTVQVVVTKMEPRYSVNLLQQDADEGEQPDTFYEYPDWYVEGWIMDGLATHIAQGLRVRLFLRAMGDQSPEPEDMYAQIIPTHGDPMANFFEVSIQGC